MRRPRFIARHASRPAGLLGRVVTAVMERETVTANEAVLERLAPVSGERVLEVGFGPGRTLGLVLDRIGAGRLAAVDHSPLMVRRARRRYAEAVDHDRLELACADVLRLPFPDRSFDAAFTVHTVYFWSAPAAAVDDIRRVLAPGGRLVMGFQDRDENRFPSSIYTFRDAGTIAEILHASGYADVAIDRPLDDDPDLAVVTASRPG